MVHHVERERRSRQVRFWGVSWLLTDAGNPAKPFSQSMQGRLLTRCGPSTAQIRIQAGAFGCVKESKPPSGTHIRPSQTSRRCGSLPPTPPSFPSLSPLLFKQSKKLASRTPASPVFLLFVSPSYHLSTRGPDLRPSSWHISVDQRSSAVPSLPTPVAPIGWGPCQSVMRVTRVPLACQAV